MSGIFKMLTGISMIFAILGSSPMVQAETKEGAKVEATVEKTEETTPAKKITMKECYEEKLACCEKLIKCCEEKLKHCKDKLDKELCDAVIDFCKCEQKFCEQKINSSNKRKAKSKQLTEEKTKKEKN